ncbi:MAG: DNA polymerase IV [Bacillaceae bacterium]
MKMSQRYYPKNGRVILHIDMNCFYASVEVAEDETLRGKPVVVAGDEKERRGIIVTCSYEARATGIKATMPLWQARKLCPNLIVLKPNFNLYRAYSYEIFRLLATITSCIQPVSIDEGYMDITDCAHLGTPLQIARQIQDMLLNELHIPCSIGIGPNKFLAKTASDMKKPLGITVLRKRDIEQLIWPRKTIEMHGIGKASAKKLQEHGIETIHDLAHCEDSVIKSLLGKNGLALKAYANGIDNRIVDPAKMNELKSIGNSYTLPHDTTNDIEIISILERICQKVSDRLKKKQVHAYHIQLTLRYYNRKTVNRSQMIQHAIQSSRDLLQEATQLWREHWDGEPIRLIGVTTSHFEENNDVTKQLDLFSYEEDAKSEPLINVLHTIQHKYGKNSIQKGIKRYEQTDDFEISLKKKMNI